MIKLCGILILNCMLCFGAAAQAYISPKINGTVYLGLTYAHPVGNFQKVYPEAQALGGNFGLLVKPHRNIRYLQVGAQVSYLVNGINKIPVNDGSDHYTIKTAHSYIPLHAVARLKPQKEMALVPYLDGLMGINILNTRSKIKQDPLTYLGESEETIVLNKQNATVFSYGLAVGLHFGSQHSKSLKGDIRLVYLEGPVATYIKNGDITITPSGQPHYKYSFSETSTLLLQLNLVGLIHGGE